MIGLADSVYSGLYLLEDAPCEDRNPNLQNIFVGTAMGSIQKSSNGCTLTMANINMEVK